MFGGGTGAAGILDETFPVFDDFNREGGGERLRCLNMVDTIVPKVDEVVFLSASACEVFEERFMRVEFPKTPTVTRATAAVRSSSAKTPTL